MAALYSVSLALNTQTGQAVNRCSVRHAVHKFAAGRRSHSMKIKHTGTTAAIHEEQKLWRVHKQY